MNTELNETLEKIDKTVKKKKEKLVEEETTEKLIKEPEISLVGLTDALAMPLDLSDGLVEGVDINVTEVLNRIQEIEAFMDIDEINALLAYLKGGERPEFMDKMMTHTNDKLNEAIKLMSIRQLLRLPTLIEYQQSLNSALCSTETLEKMSIDEISKTSVNVSKEITDILNYSIKVSSSLSRANTVPTKVERLANALLYISDSTRERIEEIIKQEG